MSTVAGGSAWGPRGRARIEAETRRDGSRVPFDRYAPSWGLRAGAANAAIQPLRDLATERAQVEGRIRVTVQGLRQAGASWTVIGDALGVSRSAAQKRYGADELPLS